MTKAKRSRSVDEFDRLKATLDVLAIPELMRQIRASEKFYAEGNRGRSFKEVFGEPLTPRQRRRRAARHRAR